jgi:threonine synthase
METTEAFLGLECVDCGTVHDADVLGPCPDCGGTLSPAYDLDAVDADAVAAATGDSMWRFDDLLPFTDPVTAAEGDTPLVDAENLAEEVGVGRFVVKDDGRNPTGTTLDRGVSLAVTAAREAGAESVTLASPGNAAQSAAAYAGRAGLASYAYVPSRAPFPNKAMVNVHGGEMRVVGGRYDDAVAALEDDDADRYPVAAFTNPYRHEGAKTVAFEVAAALDWSAPDALVVPTGTGEVLAGVVRGFRELVALGLLDDVPPLYAAQASGCAPIAAAVERGTDAPEPWETPDTIAGELEIADPAGGSLAVEAVVDSGGDAVAVDDDDILESAVVVAQRTTIEMGANAGAAAAAAWELAREGEFGADDTVVVLNTEAGGKTADLLRSHLMSKGV